MKNIIIGLSIGLIFTSFAQVGTGLPIKASDITDILTRIGILEEKHPMGYHKQNSCKTGYSFIKTTNNDYGVCAKKFTPRDAEAGSDQYTSIGNMWRCTNDGGKIASIFIIHSMLKYDNLAFKYMADHGIRPDVPGSTAEWRWYANGGQIMDQFTMGQNGYTGVQINPDQSCYEKNTGTASLCKDGDIHWDYTDASNDYQNTENVICIY